MNNFIFQSYDAILKRRVATREMFFVGTCPTIEIVGLGLSRRVATRDVVFCADVSHD